VFRKAKNVKSGVDSSGYSSFKATIKSLPPTYQHQLFFTSQIPFPYHNQQCLITERKISHPLHFHTPNCHGIFQLNLSPLIAHGYPGEFSHASHHRSDASTPYSVTLCNKKTQYINSKTKTTNTYYNFNFILNSFCYIFHNKTNSTFID